MEVKEVKRRGAAGKLRRLGSFREACSLHLLWTMDLC